MLFWNEVVLLDILGDIKQKIIDAISAIFSPFYDFVQKNVFKLLTHLISNLMTQIGPMLGTLATFMVNLWLNLFDIFLDAVGFNKLLADGAINLASDMYAAITDNEAIKKLAWTPRNFLYHGDEARAISVSLDNPLEKALDNPYYVSLKIMKDAVMPAAMVIFSLIVLVELFQITIRTEGMRNSGFETPFKLMLKVAICKLVLDNASMIIESIIGFGQEMFGLAYNTMSGVDLKKSSSGLNSIASDIAKCPWYTILMLYLQIFLQYFLIKAVMLIIPFLVFGRMVELYVMIALSPIPFSTFASQEFSQIGKSFTKQFIGTVLKSTVMYIVILVFALLFTVMTLDFASGSSDVNEVKQWLISRNPVTVAKGAVAMVIKPLIFSFMMLAGVTSSDKYVKQITGAMY